MTLEYLNAMDEPDELTDLAEYRSFIGKIQQQLPVRPDIVWAASKWATRMAGAGPTKRDREALVHGVNYLWQTRDRGLFLKRGDQDGREYLIKVIGWSDASGTTGPDSRSQICTGLSIVAVRRGATDEEAVAESRTTGLINVHSYRTSDTPLSLTEAEIVGVVEETKNVIWTRNLLKELHQEQLEATPIYNDNAPSRDKI